MNFYAGLNFQINTNRNGNKIMQVKICGTTNLEDALLSVELGADALGFIFYEKSKRFVQYSAAEAIIKQLPNSVLKVGVFVNSTIEEVNSAADKIGLSAVQLHGKESPFYTKQIEMPVIKSFRVDNKFDFALLDEYENCSLLLDNFSEKEYGGTGKSFDWTLIPEKLKDRIILAGGVSSKNIEEIFTHIKPQAVDLVSSVEKFPGKKDEEKLKEFFNIVNKLRNKC
ncbi:MAG: phosphoribosylanthranilate isomerase [Ignavibacteriales bacterium]|nr:phosphoribosylanthranilate isomerase [Ignavibacteriales bacterium]